MFNVSFINFLGPWLASSVLSWKSQYTGVGITTCALQHPYLNIIYAEEGMSRINSIHFKDDFDRRVTKLVECCKFCLLPNFVDKIVFVC